MNYSIGYTFAIREKKNIIDLMLNCIKYITSASIDSLASEQRGNIAFSLHIDKMSRIFIEESDSICSFNFPFSIEENNDYIQVFYKGHELSSKVTSVLLSILNSDIQCYESFDNMFESYYSIMEEFEIASHESSYIYWDIFTHLLLFEPGYLRYDYDIDRQNGKLHPLYHLDINYSGNNTFKLGLLGQINNQQLVDILDISTDCKFIS